MVIELFLLIWTFGQISFTLISYVRQLSTFSFNETRNFRFPTFFSVQKFSDIVLLKQFSRSGFIGQMKVLTKFILCRRQKDWK